MIAWYLKGVAFYLTNSIPLDWKTS